MILRWIRKIGKSLAALLLLPPVLALFGAVDLSRTLRRRRAAGRFRRQWHRQGRDLLLVYSRSPLWQEYIEAEWLPAYAGRAVVLNWSDRRHWLTSGSAEAALFRAYAGQHDFNPLAIAVPRGGGPVQVIRFWQAFHHRKHGQTAPLQTAEAELRAALEEAGPAASSPSDV